MGIRKEGGGDEGDRGLSFKVSCMYDDIHALL